MPLLRPAVLMHRDTDERVTFFTREALERFTATHPNGRASHEFPRCGPPSAPQRQLPGASPPRRSRPFLRSRPERVNAPACEPCRTTGQPTQRINR